MNFLKSELSPLPDDGWGFAEPSGVRFVYSVFDTRNEKEISKDVKRMRALTNRAVGAR